MQPVPDLQLLDVAEMGIERGQPLGQRCIRADPQVRLEAEPGAAVQDLPGKMVEAPRVQALGLRILVEKLLELAERTVALGPGQRRRQVIDDNGARPPLRLGTLARIVDDERIEVGQGSQHRLRPTLLRERQGLSGQPLEVAVLAEMNDRVDIELVAEPLIEGQIAVWRHEVRRVIGALGVDMVAARRLDADHEVAERQDGEGKVPVLNVRVRLGRPPPLVQGRLSSPGNVARCSR